MQHVRNFLHYVANPHKSLEGRVYFHCCAEGKHRGSARLSDWPKITQLVRGEVRQGQIYMFPEASCNKHVGNTESQAKGLACSSVGKGKSLAIFWGED